MLITLALVLLGNCPWLESSGFRRFLSYSELHLQSLEVEHCQIADSIVVVVVLVVVVVAVVVIVGVAVVGVVVLVVAVVVVVVVVVVVGVVAVVVVVVADGADVVPDHVGEFVEKMLVEVVHFGGPKSMVGIRQILVVCKHFEGPHLRFVEEQKERYLLWC